MSLRATLTRGALPFGYRDISNLRSARLVINSNRKCTCAQSARTPTGHILWAFSLVRARSPRTASPTSRCSASCAEWSCDRDRPAANGCRRHRLPTRSHRHVSAWCGCKPNSKPAAMPGAFNQAGTPFRRERRPTFGEEHLFPVLGLAFQLP
jgi:hypothetical protein